MLLSSEQRDAVLRAAQPLAPASRKPFIADVTAALEREPVLGPGVVHRVIAALQRVHFDPPDIGLRGIPRPRWGR